MQPWRKATPELKERFRSIAAGIEDVELRTMFGYPAAFVNGNMAASVHQESVMVRLSETDREERIRAGWSRFEMTPGGVPLREYMAVPPDVVDDREAAAEWIRRAVDHVRTMPPKAPKEPKRRAKAR
jgi:TfoX/Sxy family transcriptional regulator of competence genes